MIAKYKRLIFMFGVSTLFGFSFAQAAAPDIPGVGPIVEKGGVWAICGILMWWVLGKLSKQIDRLIDSVDTLAGEIRKGKE